MSGSPRNYYEWLFRSTPILATAIDEEGRFVDVSDAMAMRLGYEPAQLIGSSPLDIATPETARRIEEEFRPMLRRTGALNSVTVEFITWDGKRVSFLTSSMRAAGAEPTRLHSVAVYTETGDFTALVRGFRLFYRATPAMLHTLDAHGRVLEVSDRWLKQLGYARDEVMGRPITDFLTDSTLDSLNTGRLKRLSQVAEQTNHPREMVKKNGDVIEVLMSAVAQRDEPGRVVRLFVASKDVTERNRAERQLREAFEENARLRRALELERDYLREEIRVSMNFGEIIGSSPALQNLLARVQAVAQTPANVLIAGESGTGKELVAHAIHARSARAGGPLVKVNCASIPDELFESEFFGHVKGAFTGAVKDRIGRFQLARGGTIFLDEVSEIPLELQGKLLRVLQEKEFERVGDDRTLRVDVRVIAASNRDLRAEVDAGRFREDLYYRLSVFPVETPPLRERGDDVIQLAVQFLEQICKEFGREPLALTQGQVETLRAYTWPGNVRELKNVLERAVILSSGDTLRLDMSYARPKAVTEAVGQHPGDTERSFLTDREFRARERQNIIAALEHAGWRISGAGGAAELLGLKASTLAGRMKTFGIDSPEVRRGRPRRRAS